MAVLPALNLAGLALAALALGGCALTPGAVPGIVGAPQARPLVVATASGAVRGVAAPQGQAFLGIPFAAPPVGERRFAPPAPPLSWAGERDATKAGAACPQVHIPGSGPQSEDCLNLNVYAPHDASPAHRKPVMVWIYGGGFAIGNNVQYDPSALAEREGVVVVAPNYRLGALGFLAHPALRGPGEGAYALLDQQAALRWVAANIAAFGGDPKQVTVFGESAGGWSVCEQLASPGARGLFQRAIIQSGACASPGSVITQADAEKGGLEMAAELGCGDPSTALACLRALPEARLRKAKAHRRGILGVQSYSPMTGGDVLPLAPKDAFAQGLFPDIPIINGTNRDEGRLFLVSNRWQGKLWTQASYEKIVGDFFADQTPQILAEYAQAAKQNRGLAYADIVTDATFACPALTLNALLRPKATVFSYEFDDPQALFGLPRPPFTPPARAYHSGELVYVFGTRWALADPARFSPAQRALSDRMQDYWGSLARKGYPNSQGRPSWPADSGAEPVRLSPDSIGPASGFAAAHRCAFWSRLGH